MIGERRKATYRPISYLMRRIDATRVGIASMLELVAAGVITYFWLGQHLDGWQLTGCLLVMVGVAILQYEKQDIQNASAN